MQAYLNPNKKYEKEKIGEKLEKNRKGIVIGPFPS
jgi:hypothetical protein